jgi:hypothetical protein
LTSYDSYWQEASSFEQSEKKTLKFIRKAFVDDLRAKASQISNQLGAEAWVRLEKEINNPYDGGAYSFSIRIELNGWRSVGISAMNLFELYYTPIQDFRYLELH